MTILRGHEKLHAPVDPGTTKHPPLQIAKGASKRISTKYRSSIETTVYPCVQTSCWIKLRIHTSHYSECFFGTWLWMSHWLTQISPVCLVIDRRGVEVVQWQDRKQTIPIWCSTVFIHYTTPIFLKAITSLKKEAATCFSLKPKIWTHGHSQCPESPRFKSTGATGCCHQKHPVLVGLCS